MSSAPMLGFAALTPTYLVGAARAYIRALLQLARARRKAARRAQMPAQLVPALFTIVVEQACVRVRIAGLSRLLQPAVEPGQRVVRGAADAPAADAGAVVEPRAPR